MPGEQTALCTSTLYHSPSIVLTVRAGCIHSLHVTTSICRYAARGWIDDVVDVPDDPSTTTE